MELESVEVEDRELGMVLESLELVDIKTVLSLKVQVKQELPAALELREGLELLADLDSRAHLVLKVHKAAQGGLG